MRTAFVTASGLLVILSAIPTLAGPTPAHFWSQSFGSTSSDYGQAVAFDASGNVFLAGYFQGTVDFGGGSLVSAGGQDMVLAKYSPTGTHLWSKRFGSVNSDYAYSVATDASGNVFLLGFFAGTVNFGGSSLVSAGGWDIVVAKYSPTGTHLWSQRFGSTSTDFGYSIATDASGDVLVTGYFNGTVDFGGGSLVSAGSSDIFLAKYGSTGTHLWSQRFGSTSGDVGYSVATDASGNVYTTGYFLGTVSFGGGSLVSAGGFDIYLARYDAAGTHLWSERFGDTSNDIGYSVTADASGNAFMVGSFRGSADFGGGSLVSAGNGDIVLAGYDPAGTHLWSQRFGDTSTDQPGSVAIDASGNVVMTGFFAGAVDFGGGPLVSAGGDDICLARYSPGGTHLWSQRFGSTSVDQGASVATDASGKLVMTGLFSGTVNFGGGSLVSAGSNDMFLARYSTNSSGPLVTSITDIGNDQGRKVKIRFDRSGYDDVEAAAPITHYVAFRRDDAAPSASSRNLEDLSTGQLRADGWTEVGSVGAFTENSYGIDAPTIGDSTITLGDYFSVFYVRAATASPGTFFDSAPDSGYSLDNLAPGVPQNLVYTAGQLAWNESNADDFDFFTVYGSNVDAFGSATVVDYSVASAMDVTGSPYVYYFVTATDFSGNEGNPAVVNTLTGVGETPANFVLSVSNFPNPFNPSTTVSYTVPSRGKVFVGIFDVRGSRVATLVNNEEREAGAYRIDWKGRADDGIGVSSGVYFARIEHNAGVRTKKLVLLK